MTRSELARSIIHACQEMNRNGLNQGTAGNISHRFDNGMLISPSGIAYEQLVEDDIVYVDSNGRYEEGKVPSSEWRFHLAVLRARPDLNAVVHNHAMFSSTVSILNKAIPAIHYMVAAGGGNDIPCLPYATYGSEELSEYVMKGFCNRNAVLLEHHGMIAAETSLVKAMWLAVEVETLAKMYVQLLQVGEVRTLSEEEIERVLKKFKNYGLREKA